jgi:hypothetical protein
MIMAVGIQQQLISLSSLHPYPAVGQEIPSHVH